MQTSRIQIDACPSTVKIHINGVEPIDDCVEKTETFLSRIVDKLSNVKPLTTTFPTTRKGEGMNWAFIRVKKDQARVVLSRCANVYCEPMNSELKFTLSNTQDRILSVRDGEIVVQEGVNVKSSRHYSDRELEALPSVVRLHVTGVNPINDTVEDTEAFLKAGIEKLCGVDVATAHFPSSNGVSLGWACVRVRKSQVNAVIARCDRVFCEPMNSSLGFVISRKQDCVITLADGEANGNVLPATPEVESVEVNGNVIPEIEVAEISDNVLVEAE